MNKPNDTPQPAAQSREPESLAQRYDLRAPIGSGPMGSVYEAWDRQSDGPVALKLFPSKFSHDPRLAVRFRELMRKLAPLETAELGSILDYGFAGERYFVVSELLKGRDLASYLRERGPLSPDAALAIGRQVCSALQTLHEQGVIHRGLKPENIFVTKSGQVKLTDPGIGSLISDSGLTRTSVLSGSVAYLSPEQARGEPVGPASDLYSLGVILFEMLTDHLPYESASTWTVVRMHATEQPPWPGQYRPELSNRVCRVVVSALQKERAIRYGTAAEMEAALAAAQSTGSRSISLEPSPARSRRHPRSDRSWPRREGLRPRLTTLISYADDLAASLRSIRLTLSLALVVSFLVSAAVLFSAASWLAPAGASAGARLEAVEQSPAAAYPDWSAGVRGEMNRSSGPGAGIISPETPSEEESGADQLKSSPGENSKGGKFVKNGKGKNGNNNKGNKENNGKGKGKGG